jgi:predicted AAA+ superfamily ATPase
LKQLQEGIKDKKTFYLTMERDEDREKLDQKPENIFTMTKIDREENQIIFIDEVQYLKNPSNFLKLLYDEYHKNMKLVVSGSSSFYIDKKFKDSLM